MRNLQFQRGRVQRLVQAMGQGHSADAAQLACQHALGEQPVCPLKGIYLLDTVYARDPEHRPLTDLDLLVRPEDAEQAVRRLSDTLGLDTPTASTPSRHPWLARTLSDGSTIVDLHTTLSPVHAEAGAWSALAPQPARIHGRRAYVLDDATTLVHLVTHLVRHGPFVRLGWVEDVLRLLGAGAGDGAGRLEESVEIARRLGNRRAFLAGLTIVSVASVPRLEALAGNTHRR